MKDREPLINGALFPFPHPDLGGGNRGFLTDHTPVHLPNRLPLVPVSRKKLAPFNATE